MKKSALILSVCLMFGVIHLMKQQSTKTTSHKKAKQEWTVYEKNNESGQMESRPLHEHEKERLPIVTEKKKPDQEKERHPAQALEEQEQRYEGRKVLGHIDPQKDYRAINLPHSDWEEYFAQEMIRFQPSDARVLVKHDDQLILSDSKTLRFVEEVTVTVVKNNGEVSSFKAWADSETGLLLNTWSRSIVHNFRHRPMTFVPEDS
jgi:hypothetical protein